jgi:hypothetical protein
MHCVIGLTQQLNMYKLGLGPEILPIIKDKMMKEKCYLHFGKFGSWT